MVSLRLLSLGLAFGLFAQVAAAQTSKIPIYAKAEGKGNSVASDLQAFTGCTNPNTGVSNHDWGVGSNPVYVNARTLLVGTPAYTTNAIFWTSRETKPGQSVLLTGAFTHAAKRVKVAVIPSGTRDWQSIVRKSSFIVSATQQGTTGLSFLIPSSFPDGVYGFAIEDPSSPPTLSASALATCNPSIALLARLPLASGRAYSDASS